MRHAATHHDRVAVLLDRRFDLHPISEISVIRSQQLTQARLYRRHPAEQLVRILTNVTFEVRRLRSRLTARQNLNHHREVATPRIGHRALADANLIVTGLTKVVIENYATALGLLSAGRRDHCAVGRVARVDVDTHVLTSAGPQNEPR